MRTRTGRRAVSGRELERGRRDRQLLVDRHGRRRAPERSVDERPQLRAMALVALPFRVVAPAPKISRRSKSSRTPAARAPRTSTRSFARRPDSPTP